MTNKIKEVSKLIKNLLRETEDKVSNNSRVIQRKTDVFSTDKTSTIKANDLENNAGSVKALYHKVSSALYELAMPLLNQAAIKVEETKKIYELEVLHTKDISDELDDKFSQLKHDEFTEFDSVRDTSLEGEFKVYNQIQKRFQAIQSEYNLVVSRVRRHIPIIKLKSSLFYYTLLVFIGVCEIPLNIVIFRSFGESDYVTMIMAGTLAIAVPVLAHFIGMFWRQRSEMSDYKWKAIIMTTLFLATNFGLGVFRANVLTRILQEAGEVVTQQDFILNVAIFVGITTLLFLIGVIAAYFRHDESYTLEHTYKQYSDRKLTYEAARDAYRDLEESWKAKRFQLMNSMPQKYVNLGKQLLDRPAAKMVDYNKAITDYEVALETSRGLEMLIQSSYEYTTAASGLESDTLNKSFIDLKEFFIQK